MKNPLVVPVCTSASDYSSQDKRMIIDPQAVTLPSIDNIDIYLAALEMRRALIIRVSDWEETAALEKIYMSKVDELNFRLAHCENVSKDEPWKILDWEGRRDRAVASVRKCKMLLDQYEKEARALDAKLKAMNSNG